MKAIQYRSYGDCSENRLVDLPQPALRDGEVLVAMRTVGINPLDNTFRSGHFYGATPENLPRIGGQTGAGAVVASKSDALNVGNRVFVRGPGFGIMTDGTWRELVAAPAAGLSLIPDGIDDDQAAAYLAGAGYLTGYLALTELAKFRPGQTVLAPGIGGAVGMETVQVARRLGASLAISTASSTKKANQARAAGYDHVIDPALAARAVTPRVSDDSPGMFDAAGLVGLAMAILNPEFDVEIPAGGFVSTAADVFRFAEALRRCGAWDEARVLSAPMVALATRNHTSTLPNDLWTYARELKSWPLFPANLGLGFFLRGEGLHPSYSGHLSTPGTFGAMGAGTTNYWVDPARDMTMVCLTTGFLEEANSALRFQRLSDVAIAEFAR